MNRVKLFYAFCLMIWPTVLLAKTPVEVIIGGTHYPSMEAYKIAQERIKVKLGPASAEDQEFLRTKAKELGIVFDPKNVKTISLSPASPISEKISNPLPIPAVPNAEATGAKQLQAAGYEYGVKRVVTDFHQNWDNPVPKFTISPFELEERLGALVDGRKEPVLVVSDSKKLRVMSLGKGK